MIPGRLSPDRFAATIAARLDAVVPRGLSVRAQGSAVGVSPGLSHYPTWWGASSAAEILTEQDDRSLPELVEQAARSILNSTQDVVMENTREQWPMGPTRAADPGARVIGDHLHLWFGDEGSPVLRLESVDLTELADGAA
jgi:hypothetical protein